MRKLRLFYIYKFDSDRLKEYDNNVNITVEQARFNGELVSVGDNQVFRTIRKITKSNYSEQQVDVLLKEKAELSNKDSTYKNRDRLKKVLDKLDELMHIPEYVSIVMKSKTHYKALVKKGLCINGTKYVRLLCGAGHARKNTVIFCPDYIEQELKSVLKNGLKNIKISPSKYNAYFALYSSSTHTVSAPRVCVIPDCLIKNTHKFDWVEELAEGDKVYEKDVEMEFNLWDGMGIISPVYAKQWVTELGVNDYIPSAFTIRNSFIKGMVCTFDFHEFAEKIARTYSCINDVWGYPIKDIRDYDMVLTESQFKLWKAYDSWDSFMENCKKNDIYWGVSRVTPKKEHNHTFTNYQFVQAIKLDDNGVEDLCKDTIDWFKDISGGDAMKSILLLSGNSIENICSSDSITLDRLKAINNNMVQCLLVNKELIKDSYVKKKLYSLIQRKIKSASIGKLIVKGNYQVMISDPYAMCEYMFGMKVKGLLAEHEHYSHYWNQQRVNKVVAMRAPLTWRSEVNTLNLKNNKKIEYWYKYLNSGIVYNVHGVDTVIAADSDYDYDIVMTTDSKVFVDNACGGLPITYQKNATLKHDIDESIFYLTDIYAFDSKIGTVTNYSTSMYAMLAEYPESSPEHNELIKRLKICRKEQGSQIDKAKGIVIKEFPTHWVKEQEILETDSEQEKKRKEFENKLVIKKKPYFMKHLYEKCNREHKKYKNKFNRNCGINFKCTVDDLLRKKKRTDEVTNSYK